MERLLIKILQNSKLGVKHKIFAAFSFSRNYVFWATNEKELRETLSLL